METIKLHPTAAPIVVITPEEKEAFAKAVATLGKVFEAFKSVWEALKKAVLKAAEAMKRAFSFDASVRLHPTANVIQIPFYKAVELGYCGTVGRVTR